MKVALLEDDEAQANLLIEWLEQSNHSVSHHTTCSSFEQEFGRELPDLAVLDWELPDGSGVDVLKKIRKKHSMTVPVLFTTQRDSEQDIVTALQAGADDYLVKPIRSLELAARIDALARRANIATEDEILVFDQYEIDKTNEVIKVSGQDVKMTNKDFNVATCLFEHIGKALSREYLLTTVWGINAAVDTRTVDVHVSRVRRTLNLSPENGFVIRTLYQYGYRLERVHV